MELTPVQSANLANNVYALTSLGTIDEAIKFLSLRYKDQIGFFESNLLKGKTGGPAFIKVRTAFGFLLVGQNNLEGNAFILFRGTQYLADWLTNLNVSLSKSSCGQPVHDGFNQAFHSMLPQIRDFSNKLPTGTQVHCIGHSLGGALATIAAEWIQQHSIHMPRLYTFGSPRVGLIGFSEKCTQMLNDCNIFRAYHRTDIVPCIPIWPFVHTPNTDREFFLPSPGLVPWKTYHDMDKYVDSVETKSWDQIYAMRPAKRTDNGIETWLKSKAIIGQTMTAIEWLNDAIIYVVKKCFEYTGRIINFAASSYFTLMDQLAYILRQGIDFAKTASSWTLLLMRKIAEFLGLYRTIETVDMTHNFLRGLLMRLSDKVNQISSQALSRTLADGRGI